MHQPNGGDGKQLAATDDLDIVGPHAGGVRQLGNDDQNIDDHQQRKIVIHGDQSRNGEHCQSDPQESLGGSLLAKQKDTSHHIDEVHDCSGGRAKQQKIQRPKATTNQSADKQLSGLFELDRNDIQKHG